jgi:hypothetical protein
MNNWMQLLPGGSGSPLEARQSLFVYIPIILGIIVAVVFICTYLTGKFIKKALKIPPKSERIKKKITTPANIRHMAERISLVKSETALLAEICQTYRVPNIEYYFEDAEKTYQLFSTAYKKMSGQKNSVEDIYTLFSLLGKINKYRLSVTQVTEIHALPPGQKVYYVNEQGKKTWAAVIENETSGMIVSVLQDDLRNEERPPELSKINLFFYGKNDIAYTISVRVIRYQERRSVQEMVVTYSLMSQSHLREEFVSVPANIPGRLAAARVLHTRNSHSATYEPVGDFSPARLINFSGENCNIAAQMVVPIQQFVIFEVALQEEIHARIVGMVTKVAHSRNDNVHVLHVKYVDMEKVANNYMLARVYEFIDMKNKTAKAK